VLLCEAWIGGHPLAGLPIDEQLAHLKRGTLWAHASQPVPGRCAPEGGIRARAGSGCVAAVPDRRRVRARAAGETPR
jgi:hypothetical protein